MRDEKEILKIEEHFDELSERCDEIDVRKENVLMREIVKALKDTMRRKELTSLSAPAIGYDKRIFCLNFSDVEIKTFINPIITKAEGLDLAKEQCTSIPEKTFLRPRNTKVTVMYQTPTGALENRQFIGLAAVRVQHEMDHLDGILLTDVGLEIDDDYEKASEEEKAQVIEAYLDSLDLKRKSLKAEIEADPDLKELDEGIRFMESVAKGETKLERIPKEKQENLDNGETVSHQTETDD